MRNETDASFCAIWHFPIAILGPRANNSKCGEWLRLGTVFGGRSACGVSQTTSTFRTGGVGVRGYGGTGGYGIKPGKIWLCLGPPTGTHAIFRIGD